MFDELFSNWSVSLSIQLRITCLHVTLRELENFLLSVTFDHFVGWTAHQTVFSVACNSDSEVMAALSDSRNCSSYPKNLF